MKYIDLRFRATAQGDLQHLPPFLGATVRGALGYLLKRTVCQVSHGNCSACLLSEVCPYPSIFEGLPPENRRWMRKYPNIPQPFVLVVPPPHTPCGGQTELTWGIRLFGPACRFWPYVVHVFQAMGESGIGRMRIRYNITRVIDGRTGHTVCAPPEPTVAPPTEGHIAEGCPSLSKSATLVWTFATPTRLQSAQGQIDGLGLVLAGRRRLQIMNHFYGSEDDALNAGPHFEATDFTTRSASLRRFDLSRFSGRQKRRMKLSGLLGEVVIHGPWNEVPELLGALPVIHLGKSTSFGFGRVNWTVAE